MANLHIQVFWPKSTPGTPLDRRSISTKRQPRRPSLKQIRGCLCSTNVVPTGSFRPPAQQPTDFDYRLRRLFCPSPVPSCHHGPFVSAWALARHGASGARLSMVCQLLARLTMGTYPRRRSSTECFAKRPTTYAPCLADRQRGLLFHDAVPAVRAAS